MHRYRAEYWTVDTAYVGWDEETLVLTEKRVGLPTGGLLPLDREPRKDPARADRGPNWDPTPPRTTSSGLWTSTAGLSESACSVSLIFSPDKRFRAKIKVSVNSIYTSRILPPFTTQ